MSNEKNGSRGGCWPEHREIRYSRPHLRSLAARPPSFLAWARADRGGVTGGPRARWGLLVWMAWWWIARPVHLVVTGLLPLAVAAVFGLAPTRQIAGSYSEDTILLLLGAKVSRACGCGGDWIGAWGTGLCSPWAAVQAGSSWPGFW